jgi:dienelactone hydrolase
MSWNRVCAVCAGSALLAVWVLAGGASAQAQTQLFSESFASGLGQFTASGAAVTGSYGVRLRGGAGPVSVVSSAISTSGLRGITLRFRRRTVGLDAGETATAAFSTDGESFTTVESSSGAARTVSIELPAGAEDQDTLYIAFALDASGSSERYEVDDVVVTAAAQGPGGGGGGGSNPFARGPAPTDSSLRATRGPFGVSSYRPSNTPGFGAGTIYYPSNPSEGPFAAIAVCPGFTGGESTMSWLGPKLASHGFIVITISTNSLYDQPSSRATQLMAALQAVIAEGGRAASPIAGKVDPERTGLSGHSMGGGGTLLAGASNPSVDALVPLAPYNTSASRFSAIRAPTLVVGCQSDQIAPVASHARPFYGAISGPDKGYLEVAGADHFCVMSGNAQQSQLGKYVVAWMKRFLDKDTRYEPFLCGTGAGRESTFSTYSNTCPF